MRKEIVFEFVEGNLLDSAKMGRGKKDVTLVTKWLGQKVGWKEKGLIIGHKVAWIEDRT